VDVLALVLTGGSEDDNRTTDTPPYPDLRVGGVLSSVRAERLLRGHPGVGRVEVLGPGRGVPVIPEPVRTVLLHDADRPFAPPALLAAVLAAAAADPEVAWLPVLPVSDTIKRLSAGGSILDTVDRSRLREPQSPVALPAAALRAALTTVDPPRRALTLLAGCGVPVRTVPGDPLARRVRDGWDLRVAEALAGSLEQA
jgi:2-C-methyl-D-erythritol 4-phosphate cytidylyltransferase